MEATLQLLPAIDLRGGQVVRLERGDDGRRTVYDADPSRALRRYREAGVARIHVVDLDAAFGGPPQRGVVQELARKAAEAIRPPADERTDRFACDAGSRRTGSEGGGARIQLGGGLRDRDLRDLLGRDLGVAITGTEQIGLTVVATEGFGRVAMARKTFDILQACAGMDASMAGATQIRAGVLRPEIIVPTAADKKEEEERPGAEGLQVGDLLRVIRMPYFGRIGRVSDLPAELCAVESGARVRVLAVEFEDGEQAVVPRANVELIEE